MLLCGPQWMTLCDLYGFQQSIKSQYERSLFIVFMLLNVTSATLVRALKPCDRCPSWRSALEFLSYTARCWPVSTLDPYVSKCQAKKADLAIIINTTGMGWKSIVIATYSHSTFSNCSLIADDRRCQTSSHTQEGIFAYLKVQFTQKWK